jgi:hypothetical protein
MPTPIAGILLPGFGHYDKQKWKADRFLWHFNPHLDIAKQKLKARNNWLNQTESAFVWKSWQISLKVIGKARILKFLVILVLLERVITVARNHASSPLPSARSGQLVKISLAPRKSYEAKISDDGNLEQTGVLSYVFEHSQLSCEVSLSSFEQFNGPAICTVSDSDSQAKEYKGSFLNHVFTTDTDSKLDGLKILPNGTYCKAPLQEKKLTGKGICRYTDGSVYVGHFHDDDLHGLGKYEYAEGDIYDGEWKNGQWGGRGTYWFRDKKKHPNGNWTAADQVLRKSTNTQQIN